MGEGDFWREAIDMINAGRADAAAPAYGTFRVDRAYGSEWEPEDTEELAGEVGA